MGAPEKGTAAGENETDRGGGWGRGNIHTNGRLGEARGMHGAERARLQRRLGGNSEQAIPGAGTRQGVGE